MMKKTGYSSKLQATCLVSSVVLNVLFIINTLVGGGEYWYHYYYYYLNPSLSWSSRAAAEAEAVAAVPCSGHGRAYLDGLLDQGSIVPVCECTACYSGPDCSQFLPHCTVNAEGGDPLFMEPFWVKHAATSALVVSGWHRMSYRFTDTNYFISEELARLVRKLHSIVGNAVTENRFIIFGAGSTQIFSAATYALSLENSTTSSPTGLVASFPYYPLHKQQAEYFNSAKFKFLGDANTWRNRSDTSRINVIEFVTSPNNPNGKLNKAVLQQGPNVKTIYDHAYYWPHYTPIPSAADKDVMVFTLSKLTGHGGSRLGWALIKDENVYNRMIEHMMLNSLGVSRDAELRAFKLLKTMVEAGEGKEIFEFAYREMKSRWERLKQTISLSNRFSVQNIDPQYCTFYNKVREFTPASAWLKCERKEEKGCYGVLKAAKVIGYQGNKFGAEDRYVRVSMVRGQDDFDILIERLKKLALEEEGATAKAMSM